MDSGQSPPEVLVLKQGQLDHLEEVAGGRRIAHVPGLIGQPLVQPGMLRIVMQCMLQTNDEFLPGGDVRPGGFAAVVAVLTAASVVRTGPRAGFFGGVLRPREGL